MSKAPPRFLVERVESCASTQDLILARGRGGDPEGLVIVADVQTAGRGRHGRRWQATPGDALLCSILLRPRTPPMRLAPLAVVTGVSIALAIGGRARVRWPNDIVVDGAKVAGVLLELVADPGAASFLAIGVGVNVAMPPERLPLTDRLPATSVAIVRGAATDRDEVLRAILDELGRRYALFEDDPAAALRDLAHLDDLAGQTIELDLGSERVIGEALGVDDAGRLMLVTAEGRRAFTSGEVLRVHDR